MQKRKAKHSMIKSRIKGAIATVLVAVLLTVPVFSVNAAALNVEYSASSSYINSSYYKALREVELTGDQVTDICNVAKTQVGYHESSSGDLSGYGSGSGNYTEYGRWYGRQSYWCNVFVSWCAHVAGVPASVFPKLGAASGAYSVTFPSLGADCFKFGAKPLEAGDLIFSCTCSGGYGCIDHVGLVVDVDDEYIYTVEGNMSDKVQALTYPASTGYLSSKRARINYVARPNYQDRSASVAEIGRADALKSTENSIYTLYDMSLPYDEAEKICKIMGGHLVTITSEKEQEIVLEVLQNGSYDKYYIGLTDEENGKYLWGNGEKYDYTNITSTSSAFSAVAVNKNGSWEETVKNKRATGFICEIEIDKLIPSNTASFGGSLYEVYDNSLTYEQANAIAKSKGGKLCTIESESENKMLSFLLKESNQYYLGLNGTKREVKNAEYTNFANKVKYNEGKENYVVIKNDKTSEWSVVDMFEPATVTGFIVEYDSQENKNTITYDANGGMNTPIEQVGVTGENIAVTDSEPVNEGKKFLGWAKNANSQKAEFVSGEKMMLTEDVVLYAVWG